VSFFPIAVFACGLVAFAQQPPPAGRPQFRATTEIVHLDVSVLDKKTRRPVQGLTAADFTILEDGTPRPVVAFSAVDVPAPVAPTARWMRDVPVDVGTNQFDGRRLVTVVMDDATLGGQLATRNSAIAAAHKVIDDLGPTDVAAVVYSIDNRRRQDFTTDRAKLHAAIDRLGPGAAGRLNVSGETGAVDVTAAPSPVGRLDGDTYHGGCICGLCSIRVLRDVAESLRSEAALRKLIVFVSGGLNVDWMRTGSCGGRQHDEMQRTFLAARIANVTIYTVDAAGLRIEPGLGGPMEYLQVMAENTGGRPIINTNAPEREVPRIFAENASYYLLAYELEGAKPQGDFYRRLEVKVNRPDVEVRSRKQFYGPPVTTSGADADEPASAKTLEAAVTAVLPARDVDLRVHAAAFGEAERPGHASVTIVLGVDQPLLETPPDASGQSTEHVYVLVHAFDADGRSRASQTQDATIVMRPERGGRAVFEILTKMELEPGRYSLRIAAGSREREKVGSVGIDIDVPTFRGVFSVSEMLLSAEPSPVAAPRDALSALVPVVPTARRRFAKATRVSAFVRLYQPSAGRDVGVLWQVRDARDKTLTSHRQHVAPEAFARTKTVDLTPSFSLDSLAPGEYVLTFTATFNRRVTTRHVRFTVTP
jgi:VWFA-related protein